MREQIDQTRCVGRGRAAIRLRRVSLAPRGLTVEEAAEEWLSVCAGTYKRSTLAMYRILVDKHIKPELGPCPVHQLTGERVTLYLNRKSHGAPGQPPLAPSTVCSIITVLRSVLRRAQRRGWAAPALEALERPRKKPRETTTLTGEEQRRLEALLWEDLDLEKLGVLLCLYTGLRIGEVCALKWGDISTEGVLTVRRTVQRIRNPDRGQEGQPRTILVFDTPKSDSSRRSIPVPSGLAEVLEGCRRPPECFFLTGEEDSFREPRALQSRFKTYLKRAGLRDINFHALRHTFATNCVQLGFDPKTLSRILGHSTVNLTLDTYVHPSLAAMRNLMERLNAPLREEEPALPNR